MTRWTIHWENYALSVEPAVEPAARDPWSTEALNGTYPSELAAYEEAIAALESVREEIATQLRSARSQRRKILRRART